MTTELIGASGVAGILGVSRQRVAQLARVDANFPEPEDIFSGRRMWSPRVIEAWALAHPDRGPRHNALALPPPGKATENTWKIYELAAKEASELNHQRASRDHLLLATIHSECPGAARRVLDSFHVTQTELRSVVKKDAGPPDNKVDGVLLPVAVHVWTERANVKAVELRDEVVNSEHLLLALADDWTGSISTSYLQRRGIDSEAVRERVLALTDAITAPDTSPATRPLPSRSLVQRIPRLEEPTLATTPSGHDPHERKPWGSAVFHDDAGRPLRRASALRQYFLDCDGSPVRTTEGSPVHLLTDDDGNKILDEEGHVILVPVEAGARSWRLRSQG